MVLQPEARHTLFGALDLAASGGAPEGIGHGVGFVESDHAVEILADPGKDLFKPRILGASRAQRRIGDEENAFGHRYRVTESPARERLEIERQPAKRFPVAACIFEQRLVLGDPYVATLAGEPAVHNDRGYLPSLARPGPVTEEKTLAVFVTIFGEFQRGAFLADLELAREIARECLGSVDQRLALRFGKNAVGLPASGKTRYNIRLGRRDRPHGDRFHERGRMNRRVFERDAAGPVRQVDAGLFGHRCGVGQDRIGKIDRIRSGWCCRCKRRHRPDRRAMR